MTNLIERFVDFATGEVTADVNNSAVNTEQADITNETLILVEQTTDQSNLSSSTWHTVTWDVEQKDEQGEFDLANNRFSPDSTGWYAVRGSVVLNPGSDGDITSCRLRNVTDNTDVPPNAAFPWRLQPGGSTRSVVVMIGTFELASGKDYELQIRDANSSFETKSSDGGFWSIRSAYR